MSNIGESTTGKPLMEGLDMNNPPVTHEKNAEILRNFSIKRSVFNKFVRSRGLFPPIMATLGALLNGETRTIQILDYQLIALRMTETVSAESLFGVNKLVPRVIGMGDEKIDALRKGLKAEGLFAMKIWTKRQQCTITLVDESVATWTNKRKHSMDTFFDE